MKLETIDKRLLLVIPAIFTFFLVLIPTLKYQWPLGWDVFYHIHMAKLYSTQGLVFTDPLFNAPVGHNVNYPPLFHLLIVFIGLTGVDYFQITRFMQPVMAGLIVLSVTYVSWKFYGKLAGISAGFLMLSSSIISRILIPLPENLALIFLPLSVYLYFTSLKSKNYKNALYAGLLLGLVALIHQAATLCLLISVTAPTIILLIINLIQEKNLKILKDYATSYGLFLLVGGVLAALWWIPSIFNAMSQTVSGGLMTSLAKTVSLSIFKYPGAFGYLLITLGIIGTILGLKKKRDKDIFIITWFISMLFLSKSYLLGINVISYRILIYILIPLSIIASYGLKSVFYFLYNKGKTEGKSSPKHNTSLKFKFNKLSPKLAYVLVTAVLLFSLFSGASLTSRDKISEFGATTSFGVIDIAPPTAAQVDLAQWMEENGSENGSSSFSNYYASVFNLAYTNQAMSPINYTYQNGTVSRKILQEAGVEYLIYDKKLSFTSKNDTAYLSESRNSLYFYNKNIIDISNLVVPYLKKIYENKEFVVYQVI